MIAFGTHQRFLATLVALTTLVACVDQRKALIEKGATPAYADGYVAGCKSGKQAAGSPLAEASKDTSRYGANNDYARGWDDAFRICKADMEIRILEARRRNPQDDK
ncbi:MAG: hypothetical protein ACR2QJ_06285 [Geminicoccaceae bacterium]